MTQIKFNYKGEYQTFILQRGIYGLHLYGAQGGGKRGGLGGYSHGIIKLQFKTTFYAFVGGQGKVREGGFNGGGNGGKGAGDYTDGAGGGGSTDIRYSVNDLDSRIIVAAGGGGTCGTGWSAGANGGGISGDSTYNNGVTPSIEGATQTTGNAKLYGMDAPNSENYSAHGAEGNGGGGGGWYGGKTNSSTGYATNSGGSGGSSYISGHPSCIKNNKYVLSNATTITGKNSGNGYIIIITLYRGSIKYQQNIRIFNILLYFIICLK